MAVLPFGSPQGGMQAHYLARWVNRTDAMWPWSETTSATVAAQDPRAPSSRPMHAASVAFFHL